MNFQDLVHAILAAGNGSISENDALAIANQVDRAFYDEVDVAALVSEFNASLEAQDA